MTKKISGWIKRGVRIVAILPILFGILIVSIAFLSMFILTDKLFEIFGDKK